MRKPRYLTRFDVTTGSAECQYTVYFTCSLACAGAYQFLEQENHHRILGTSVRLTFQCGELCNRECIVKSSEILII